MGDKTMSASDIGTREEHLLWCKNRALELVDAGDVQGAFASFVSDVSKHSETADIKNVIGDLGLPLMMTGLLSQPHQMRERINGYK